MTVARSAMNTTTAIVSETRNTPRYPACTASGIAAASAMPALSSGSFPAARAIRYSSHDPIAATAPSAATNTQPPAKMRPRVRGMPTSARRILVVSSDTSSDFHDFCFFSLQKVVDFRDEVIVQLLQVLLRMLHVVLARVL